MRYDRVRRAFGRDAIMAGHAGGCANIGVVESGHPCRE